MGSDYHSSNEENQSQDLDKNEIDSWDNSNSDSDEDDYGSLEAQSEL